MTEPQGASQPMNVTDNAATRLRALLAHPPANRWAHRAAVIWNSGDNIASTIEAADAIAAYVLEDRKYNRDRTWLDDLVDEYVTRCNALSETLWDPGTL